MNLVQTLKMIRKNPKNVWHYFLGNYRYYFYYGGKLSAKSSIIASLRKRVIRPHIKEQIDYRIQWMNKDCYNNGSCVLCGCQTTALQMCNKPCDKPCYPEMMTKSQWKAFKRGTIHSDKNGMWLFIKNQNELQLLKRTMYGFTIISSNKY